MKLFSFFGSLILLVCFSSCTPNFVPAMYLHDETYMSKPFLVSSDTTHNHKQSVHLSAKVTSNLSDIMVIGENVKVVSGMLQVHQAHSFRVFNIAYGLQAAGGIANVPTSVKGYYYTPKDSSKKTFQALGVRLEVGLKMPLNTTHFEWRALNFSFNHSHEFGNYLRFREKLASISYLNVSRGSNMYSWGLFTEFAWHFGKINPANSGDGLMLKLGYLNSNFMDNVYHSNMDELEKKQFRRKNNFTLTIGSQFDHWSVVYQTISSLDNPVFAIPILTGISHSLLVSTNLSTLLRKKK